MVSSKARWQIVAVELNSRLPAAARAGALAALLLLASCGSGGAQGGRGGAAPVVRLTSAMS